MSESSIYWPNRDDVKAKYGRGEPLNSTDELVIKSRSFAKAIEQLGTLKGPTEHDKSVYVKSLYNWARWVDEIEDAPIKREIKLPLLTQMPFVMSQIVSRDEKASLDDIVNGGVFKQISSHADEWFGADQEAYIFMTNFANIGFPNRDGVLEEFQGFSKPVQEMMRDCIHTMTGGMHKYVNQGRIRTITELDEYVYFVAGIIGEKTGRLVELVDGDGRLADENGMKKGRAFAKLLQLTNIIKGIRPDYDARANFEDSRTLFLPTELYEPILAPQLVYGPEKDFGQARKKVFDEMMKLARSNINDSLDYALLIPEELTGYQAFCVGPMIAAIETLNHMEKHGAEEVFKGSKEATSISRDQMQNVVKTVYGATSNRVTYDKTIESYRHK